MTKFNQLPNSALSNIIRSTLQSDPTLTASFLSSFGSHIATTTRQSLCRSLALADDDSILVEAEDVSDLSRTRSLLSAIWRDDEGMGNFVEELHIVRARTTSEGEGRDGNSSSGGLTSSSPLLEAFSFEGLALDATRPPLEDLSFFLLLSKLPNLNSFTWSTNRIPPASLCSALGQTAKSLTSFKFELTSSRTLTNGQSPEVGTLGEGNEEIKLRWDANDIAALPASLVHLSVSHLSADGAVNLAEALESSFPGLESLELTKTRFVDDTLVLAMAEGCKRLLRFKLREMSGTKLTDVSLIEVFKNETIEELILDDVEGRFTKNFWKKLLPLPESFKSIRIAFAEEGSHHSWIVDHLESFALFTSPSLGTISVTRKLPAEALKAGAETQKRRHLISEVVAPRPLPAAMLKAIIAMGDRLQSLEIDYWEIDLASLKMIMDKNVGLVKLRVLLDEPMKSLLTLASSFALTTHLRSFVISINPRHNVRSAFTAVSPQTRTVDLSSSHKSTMSSKGTIDSEEVAPPLRDWRRLLKKSQRLEVIEWTGRGGIGKWKVSRGGIGSSVKVEYEPNEERNDESDEEEDPRRRDGSGLRSKARRTSSVSLAGSVLSSFNFSPSSMTSPSCDSGTAGLGIDNLSNVSSPCSTSASRRRSSSARHVAPLMNGPIPSVQPLRLDDSFPALGHLPVSPKSSRRDLPMSPPSSSSSQMGKVGNKDRRRSVPGLPKDPLVSQSSPPTTATSGHGNGRKSSFGSGGTTGSEMKGRRKSIPVSPSQDKLATAALSSRRK